MLLFSIIYSLLTIINRLSGKLISDRSNKYFIYITFIFSSSALLCLTFYPQPFKQFSNDIGIVDNILYFIYLSTNLILSILLYKETKVVGEKMYTNEMDYNIDERDSYKKAFIILMSMELFLCKKNI